MVKKLLFFAFITTALANIAQASNSTPKFQSGAYGGAALGISSMKSKNNENVILNAPAVGIQIYDENRGSNKTHRAIAGDIFVGYRHILNNGILAGVDFTISLDRNKIKHKSEIDNGSITNNSSLQTRYKIVPAIVLGSRVYDRFLAFLKLGISYTEFKISHNSKYDDLPGASPNPSTNDRSKKRNIGFYTAGALEMAINENVSTLAMVSYEHFNKIQKSFKYTPNLIGAQGEGVHSVSFKPQVYTFKVGLIYRFSSN